MHSKFQLMILLPKTYATMYNRYMHKEKWYMNENNDKKTIDIDYLDPVDRKKIKRKRIIIYILISILGSTLLNGFGLMWQRSLDLMALVNAFYLTAFLWFFIGWMVLMANLNILSPVVYGIKSFFLILVGRRPKEDYYNYQNNVKENPIAKVYIALPMISIIPNLIVAIILHMQL